MKHYSVSLDRNTGGTNIVAEDLDNQQVVAHALFSSFITGAAFTEPQASSAPASMDRWLGISTEKAEFLFEAMTRMINHAYRDDYGVKDNFINQIKFVRFLSGCGLRDAKYWVDERFRGVSHDADYRMLRQAGQK